MYRRYLALVKTIAVPPIYRRHIVPTEISLKYRRYKAMVAIFGNYRLHHFCKVLNHIKDRLITDELVRCRNFPILLIY